MNKFLNKTIENFEKLNNFQKMPSKNTNFKSSLCSSHKISTFSKSPNEKDSDLNFNFLKKDHCYYIYTKPKSSRSKICIIDDNDKIVVFVKSLPIDNKANAEIIKLFKKDLNIKIDIISGFRSKNKKIKIIEVYK